VNTDVSNQNFKLSFDKRDTVEIAKKRVAEHFGVSPKDITLIFGGKALKSGFVLNRLRIGSNFITVYITDTSLLLLKTGAAMINLDD
jgi:hypothetical protein